MSIKTLQADNITTSRSFLNQLVDVVASDISSSNSSATRKKFLTFVTGGVGPGVTSSLFQKIFDQDSSLQTANPMLDMTVGLFSGSDTVAGATSGPDAQGKLIFVSQSIMMREKINIYRQYAQNLLGNAEVRFAAPFGDTTTTNLIDEALFINVQRLFARDAIKRETFAMRMFQTGVMTSQEVPATAVQGTTLNVTSPSGSVIFTDSQSTTSLLRSQVAGDVGNLVDASNTSRTIGNIFYDAGVVVLDLNKVISGSQHVSGVIGGLRNGTFLDLQTGQVGIGTDLGGNNRNATYIPDLLVSASIDDIVDHFASCRFGNDTTVTMTFQNQTEINSTIYSCQLAGDEFNLSSNPTYVDSTGRIRAVPASQQGIDKPFTFVTTIGLTDAAENVVAVAKLSRPIEKNEEKELIFRVRLDY